MKLKFDLSPKALDRWNPGIMAASSDDTTISIYDVIGEDYWTGEGVTMNRISAALRSIGERDVSVNINSPGGDMFEGLAIYNLLREHKGRVTVKVLGLAASAASLIAMAGDEIQIARAGFLMIHNSWIMTAGNRHELREYADYLEPFDASMADVYAVRTGLEKADTAKIMDAETWIGGSEAVENGWADALLASDEIKEADNPDARAVIRMEQALAKAGMSRSERRKLISEYKNSMLRAADHKVGTPGAAGNDMPGAVMVDCSPMQRITFPIIGGK